MFQTNRLIVLLLCTGLAGAALAETGGSAEAPPAPAPASAQGAEPTAEQIAAWLATARALQAEQPTLFEGA